MKFAQDVKGFFSLSITGAHNCFSGIDFVYVVWKETFGESVSPPMNKKSHQGTSHSKRVHHFHTNDCSKVFMLSKPQIRGPRVI